MGEDLVIFSERDGIVISVLQELPFPLANAMGYPADTAGHGKIFTGSHRVTVKNLPFLSLFNWDINGEKQRSGRRYRRLLPPDAPRDPGRKDPSLFLFLISFLGFVRIRLLSQRQRSVAAPRFSSVFFEYT